MKFKKPLLITFILITLSIASCLGLGASAAQTAVFTVETDKTAVAGSSFTVDVTLNNNTGFAGLSLDLTYNQKYLTLEKVECSSVFEDMGALVVMSEKVSAMPFTVQIASEDNIAYNGVVFTATFSLSKDATLGNYPIEVSCGKNMMFDKDLNSIQTSCVAGGVSIECDHKYESTVVDPKCDAKGYTEYRCTECHAYYQANWVDELPHDWKTLSSTKPTCTEDGELNRKCRECGTEETVSNGEATGHSYKDGQVIPSTCSAEGYTLHKCENCNYEYRDNYTPLADHSYEERVTQEPTCKQVGYKKLSCIHCDYSYTEEIGRSSCKYVESARQEATHSEKGWTAYECEYCGSTKKADYVDPLSYDLEFQVITKPTCTAEGLGKNVCKDGCGYEKEEIIPATGHVYGEWTVELEATEMTQGLKSRVCLICTEKESESIPKLSPAPQNTPTEKDNAFTRLIAKFNALSGKIKLVLLITLALVVSIVLFCALVISRLNADNKKKKKKRKK